MTEHERLLEEFDDAYFALLMEGVARKEGEQLEALNEMLQDNPEAAVPERVDKRCLETIDRHFAREQRRIGLRKTGKVLRLAAVIMGISVLLFTSAFALSEEFRVATLNLMVTIRSQYTQFDIQKNESDNKQVELANSHGYEYFQNADIRWLPDGFEYCAGEYNQFTRFENDSGREFHLHTLRHYFVSTMLHNGVDKQTVAELAGHGDTGFLERTYCHPQLQLKREAAERYTQTMFDFSDRDSASA